MGTNTTTKFLSTTKIVDLGRNVVEPLRQANIRLGRTPTRSVRVRAKVEARLIIDYLSEGSPRRLGPARTEPSPPSTLQEGGLHLVHPVDSLNRDWLDLELLWDEHEERFPQEQLQEVGINIADDVISPNRLDDIPGTLVEPGI